MPKVYLLVIALLITCFSSYANIYQVTTVADTGLGSLRAAIDSSNNNPGLDTIVLYLTLRDTIHVGSPLPTIRDSLIISGLPCQNPTITGDSIGFLQAAIFVADSTVPLTLGYLNIANFKTSGPGGAGVVYAGRLYIYYCYFYANFFEQTSSGPGGTGGAAYARHLWAYNSTFNSNSCIDSTGFNTGWGGALYSGDCNLFNCTFINNYATADGGAVCGTLTQIQNCTFTQNFAGGYGGGLYGNSTSNPNQIIGNSIIWGNSIGDSTVANSKELGFAIQITSGGCNILQDTASSDSFATVASDAVGANPLFGTLGYYSGCVPVLPIFCGSPAQDWAACPGVQDSDAQGIAAQGIRDAGAFEITGADLGPDNTDTIDVGATADLFDYVNTTGLTIHWPDSLNDSSAMAVGAGIYIISGTNFLGCSAITIVTIVYGADTVNGITGIRPLSFKLFPNPAKDFAVLQWSDYLSGSLNLKVTDVLGRQIVNTELQGSGGEHILNTMAFSSGVYYLVVSNGQSIDYAAKLMILNH